MAANDWLLGLGSASLGDRVLSELAIVASLHRCRAWPTVIFDDKLGWARPRL